MNTASKEYDDLTQISGIGDVRQQRLQESLGVYTFEDLAKLTVAEIQSDLKAGGHSVSEDAIKEWLAEARQRAQSAEQMTHSSASLATEETQPAPAPEGKWETAAAFIVEFQRYRLAGTEEKQRTKIHHMQSGKDETWPNVEGQHILPWMLSRLEAEPQPILTKKAASQGSLKPAPAMPAQHKPEDKKSVKVPITQVKIYQPMETNTPMTFGQADQLFSGNVRGNEPFALEAAFELDDALSLANHKTPVQYHIGFSVDNRATGKNIHLGTTRPKALQRGPGSYTARLDELKLQRGVYRLQVLVTVQTTANTLSFLEIPLLQVI